MSDQKKTHPLVTAAVQARKHAQARYSHFEVGAALETKDGKVYSGCNVESSSYGLTICAERVALTKAISEGEREFTRIAIVGPDDEYCPPCGACRQLLFDYAPELEVITSNGSEIQSHPLKDLLPFAFEETKLKRS